VKALRYGLSAFVVGQIVNLIKLICFNTNLFTCQANLGRKTQRTAQGCLKATSSYWWWQSHNSQREVVVAAWRGLCFSAIAVLDFSTEIRLQGFLPL
jgi:hypothetical protein